MRSLAPPANAGCVAADLQAQQARRLRGRAGAQPTAAAVPLAPPNALYRSRAGAAGAARRSCASGACGPCASTPVPWRLTTLAASAHRRRAQGTQRVRCGHGKRAGTRRKVRDRVCCAGSLPRAPLASRLPLTRRRPPGAAHTGRPAPKCLTCGGEPRRVQRRARHTTHTPTWPPPALPCPASAQLRHTDARARTRHVMLFYQLVIPFSPHLSGALWTHSLSLPLMALPRCSVLHSTPFTHVPSLALC